MKHANKTEKTVGTAGFVIEMGAHIAVWIATAVAYRLGKTGNDLWGWTCSDKADQIQDQFQAVIDFNNFCNVQVCSPIATHSFCELTIATVVICMDTEYCPSCCPGYNSSRILPGLETYEAQGKDGERHDEKSATFLISVCTTCYRKRSSSQMNGILMNKNHYRGVGRENYPYENSVWWDFPVHIRTYFPDISMKVNPLPDLAFMLFKQIR